MTPRLRSAAFSAVLLTACGPWQREGASPSPSASQTLTSILDLPSVYRRMGRLTAGPPLPFVGSVGFVAGPADSTLAIVAISLENRVLGFERDGATFVARYRAEISFQRTGATPVAVTRNELVRVSTFAETQRSDESIVFQQFVRLAPGDYHLAVSIRDAGAQSASRAEQDVTAPTFGPGSLSAPIIVYEVRGRSTAADTLALIVNPRGTTAYGGAPLLAYVEGYRMAPGTAVPLEVGDERDSVVFRDTLRFKGGQELEGHVIRLAPDSTPLGELRLSLGTAPARRTVSALVSFSSQWLVTNYVDMIDLLRYFGHADLLRNMDKAPPSERARLWREFWVATDPNPATPENEALDRYFARLAIANRRFSGEGIDGWRTDRGEVFITFGEPDEVYDASAASQGRVIRWMYTSLGVSLFFVDETGFGRFRLTPGSRAQFEQVRGRLQRRNP